MLVGVLLKDVNVMDVFCEMIRVDALDATDKCLKILERALSLYRVDVVLLDGVTYAGFNILNPYALHSLMGIPVIVAFRYPLSLDKILRALKNNFADWRYRYRVIENVYLKAKKVVFSNGTKLLVTCIGINEGLCIDLIHKITFWHPNPEPLRIADVIASAIGKKVFEKFTHVVSG